MQVPGSAHPLAPFSKFDPHRPARDEPEPMAPGAARRVWILRWGVWIYTGMLVLGYVLIAYWLSSGSP
jgi:hypothetical protein